MTAAITWWGHATTTVELAGVRVLTDPVLTGRVAHLARAVGPAPGPDAARASVVVISHLHADHLHLPSLRGLASDVRLVAPRGTAGLLRRSLPELARRVDEVAEGDKVTLGELEIRAVRARHDGRRLPASRHAGPALGYVLDGGARRVWFAGDTGLFDEMSDIGPVDAAIVPVGGWGPTLGPGHLDPAQAAEAVRRVEARHAVPVHYGTLWPIGLDRLAPGQFARLCRGPGRAFGIELAASDSPARAHVIAHGETVTI